MNPFDLRGPQFLAFYAALTLLILLLIWLLRRRIETRLQSDNSAMKQGLVLSHTHPGFTQAAFNDPYLIAYLRGGSTETIRTAVVSLVDRGLLTAGKETVQTSAAGSGTPVRRTIERELLTYCKNSTDPKYLFKEERLVRACDEYETQLVSRNLLPDEATKRERRTIFLFAAATLLAFSLIKVIVAFARGRTNVLFLIFLTIISLVIASAVAFPRMTASGSALLDEIRNLFSSLKLRAAQIRPGGATAELSLLVAVFGISALNGADFAWTKLLFPAPSSDGSSSSSSSGSSCGSSCGGGCGGGCGGCGG